MKKHAIIGPIIGVGILVAAASAAGAPPSAGRLELFPSSKEDIGFTVGGGAAQFFGSALRNNTDVAGYWDARVVAGTHSVLGFEGGYQGSAQSLNALGLASKAALVGHGIDAEMRLQLPVTQRSFYVTPYALGGIGWTRFNIVNSDSNTSSFKDEDDVVMLPVGGGVSVVVGQAMLDLRFTYRPAFDPNLLPAAGGGYANMDSWSAGAKIGFTL